MTEIKTKEELVNELLEIKVRIEKILAQLHMDPQDESRDIKRCLISLGISPNTKGFAYLAKAIEIGIKDFDMARKLSKELYPEIAKIYGTTASRVGHDIEIAIEKGMPRANEDLVKEIFVERKKFTNSEFIATLADYFRSDIKTEEEGPVKINKKEIAQLLKRLGVPTHIKGYDYIQTAIIMCIENQRLLRSLNKELYPKIAEVHGTSALGVERAIRYAIEVSFDKTNQNLYTELFFEYTESPQTRRPTNSQYLATLVDYITVNKND